MANRTRPGLVTADLEKFIDVDLLGDGTTFAEQIAAVIVDKNGNPISTANPTPSDIEQVGGVAVPTNPAGQRVGGVIPVALYGPAGYPLGQFGNNDDFGDDIAQVSGAWPMIATARQKLYNEGASGHGWDRQRNNTQGTLLASAARTASVSSPNQTNYNARGVTIFVVVTAISGAGATLAVQLQLIDPVTGNTAVGPSFGGITAPGNYAMQAYPGVSSNGSNWLAPASVVIPRIWAAGFNISGTTPSITFSAGFAYDL